MKTNTTSVTAFAPASVANVAVGFDVMGFAAPMIGDTVTITKVDTPSQRPTVTLSSSHSKGPDRGNTQLPMDPLKNTATAGLVQLIKDRDLKHGFEVSIEKGIPMGSGLGGSAASSAAAIFAASDLLEKCGHRPLTRLEMIRYALIGEHVASQSFHADNIAPSLFGGLLMTKLSHESADFTADVVELPIPHNLWCTVLHPDLVIETKTARGILKKEISLQSHIEASANMAFVLAGLYTNDFNLIQKGLKDILIEPQRAHLISKFHEIKSAALNSNRSLGCSISGAGPSVFSWSEGEAKARDIEINWRTILPQSRTWVFRLEKMNGARIL